LVLKVEVEVEEGLDRLKNLSYAETMKIALFLRRWPSYRARMRYGKTSEV
jgi:hypothetical protein